MMIYCDSVILIYLLDHTGVFQARGAGEKLVCSWSGLRFALLRET
jgi:hypothetical protein